MHMYKRQGVKGYRDGGRTFVHKHTNTPSDFVMCSLCEEKFQPKRSVHSCLGDQERNIREYSNALSYINSCHSIINHMMMQNKDFKDSFVHMPSIPNFMDLFSVLLTHGWESKKKDKPKSCEPHLIRSRGSTVSDQQDHQRASTESEASDFEMDLIQNASKLPMHKFKSKLPRTDDTIYEEELPASANKQPKRSNAPTAKTAQRKTSPCGPRGKRYSDIISPPVQDTPNRKAKQRSYSAASPRSKGSLNDNKSGGDLSVNYSDTVINHSKTEITQQDLDKFAKELLGSGSGSPIHTPRSSSPDNRSTSGQTPDKSPSRIAKKTSKPGSPPSQCTRKYSELLKKNYNGERSSSPAHELPSSNKPSESSMTPITIQAKKTKSKLSQRASTDSQRPGTPTLKMSGVNNYSVYATLQAAKDKAFSNAVNGEDNPYAMQQYIQLAMKKNEQSTIAEVEEPYEKQDTYEPRKSLRSIPSKCAQYTVKMKPKDSGRKLSAADMKIIESQVQLFVEQHIESDDGKTDSDIEEDKKQKAEERQGRSEERKNFRGPRKQSESDDEDQVVKFNEGAAGYQRLHPGTATTSKRNQISDESSDIKSDEDGGAYDHRQRPSTVHVHRRGASYSYSPRR